MKFTELRKLVEEIESTDIVYPDYLQPNPEDYPDTPEGDEQYFNDYWQGDIEAFLYHENIGDR